MSIRILPMCFCRGAFEVACTHVLETWQFVKKNEVPPKVKAKLCAGLWGNCGCGPQKVTQRSSPTSVRFTIQLIPSSQKQALQIPSSCGSPLSISKLNQEFHDCNSDIICWARSWLRFEMIRNRFGSQSVHKHSGLVWPASARSWAMSCFFTHWFPSQLLLLPASPDNPWSQTPYHSEVAGFPSVLHQLWNLEVLVPKLQPIFPVTCAALEFLIEQ